MKVKEMRELLGLSQNEFSKKYATFVKFKF